MSNMMVNASKYSYLSISKAPFQGRKISRLPYWYASCIMIVSYVFADSQTYILLNSDLPNTSITNMAIWEYPFRHALATFLA